MGLTPCPKMNSEPAVVCRYYYISIAYYLSCRYYLSQEDSDRKPPRGVMNLIGAKIIPNDEDVLEFFVQPKTGEPYKLRANDHKEKQEWVKKLRTAANKDSQFQVQKYFLLLCYVMQFIFFN